MKAALLIPLLLMPAFSLAQYAEVDASMSRLMKVHGVPGASVGIMREGRLIYAKGYGEADVENHVRSTPDTVYQIASVTKTFTSAIVMLLAREGKLSLEDRVSTYLESSTSEWKEITLRQLLTHTSGIRNYTDIPGVDERASEKIGRGELLALIEKQKLDFSPGTNWQYSNSGYFLLGLVIEKIEGKPYAQVLKERITSPLGMKSTRVNDASAVIPFRATGYAPNRDRVLRRAVFDDPSWPYAAGAIVSSVVDMAKWDAALYPGKLFSQKELDQIWKSEKLADGSKTRYGCGWFIHDIHGVLEVEHGGDIDGFQTEFVRVPSKKLSVIVICNSEPGLAPKAAEKILTILDPGLQQDTVESAHDAHPELTHALRAAVADFLGGSMRKDSFEPAAIADLTPHLPDIHRVGQIEGDPKEFFLIHAKEQKDITELVYFARMRDESLAITLRIDKQGKIASMGMRLLEGMRPVLGQMGLG